jgi:hypothetical protein
MLVDMQAEDEGMAFDLKPRDGRLNRPEDQNGVIRGTHIGTDINVASRLPPTQLSSLRQADTFQLASQAFHERKGISLDKKLSRTTVSAVSIVVPIKSSGPINSTPSGSTQVTGLSPQSHND